METLAYIHHALAYEKPAIQRLKAFHSFKVFKNSCLYLVSVMSALVGMTSVGDAKVLRLGDNGTEVVTLQQRLQELGYFNQRPTGFFREITRDAVVKFQQSKGLTADGVVGPQTEAVLIGTRSLATGNLENSIPVDYLNNNSSSGRVLRRGDSGQEVTKIQTTMQGIGIYQGPITGYFGSLTEAAIKEFQQSQGLKLDGMYGSSTRSRLQVLSRLSSTTNAITSVISTQQFNSSSNTGILLQEGDRGDGVTKLQKDLQVAGVYNGPVTGYFGSWTKASVSEFQRLQGLKVDGIAGPATLSVLENASSSIASSTIGSQSVLKVQKNLRSRGFYRGQLDGKMGPLTEQAIAAAQSRYNVSAEDIRNGRF